MDHLAQQMRSMYDSNLCSYVVRCSKVVDFHVQLKAMVIHIVFNK